WEGRYLRKKRNKVFDDSSLEESVENEDIERVYSFDETNELIREQSNENNGSETGSKLSWKLTLPDEFANITFINNNTYNGRISRKMMEGEGVFKWSNGVQYKGAFEQNRMHGRGLLEWNNNCWYEGDFENGYRHGRGLLVHSDHHFMYTGQWFNGHRHGKGYCRYEGHGSYDGDWVMDEMYGVGLRIYPSGARYMGQWNNGLRNGIGTMVWPNGDVYRGEWRCGAMNGYGEYTWNGFFNKTFSWPQEASYVGELKLNTVGGAKYSGYWEDNKKHGPGIIIGPFIRSVPSGKCYACENRSCSCLETPLIDTAKSEENVSTDNVSEFEREYEERWLYNCLTMHISCLRRIYEDYARLFAASAPKANLVMSRLCLWQLWRDCNITAKGLSLIEIDKYIAKNESTFMKDPHHPFEKIEIWQFLHALLEVSWHLYAKHDSIVSLEMNGRLASNLHKFLQNDIYPHAENHIGILCRENKNLLPMSSVFELYQSTGYPCSAKDILQAVCRVKDTLKTQSSPMIDQIAKYLPRGINAVTIGGRVSYVLKVDEIFSPVHNELATARKHENNQTDVLLVFKELGAAKMIDIIALICPGVKDPDSGVIININYEVCSKLCI
ncbi:Radial spoke head 10 like protein B, partial [Dufourea novaeangliae]